MRRLTVVFALLAAALPPVWAQMSTYSAPLSATTYAAIPESAHGIDSPAIGVVCRDTTGQKLSLAQLSWTVDPSSYEVDLTFTNTFTGICKLSGPWPAGDTGNATDFAVTIGQSDNSQLNVCAQCGVYTARRTYNGDTNVANAGAGIRIVNGNWQATTVFVYIQGNTPTFGLNSTVCIAGSSSTVNGPNVECGVMSMPTGAGITPLATATVDTVADVFTSVTDQRPWQ